MSALLQSIPQVEISEDLESEQHPRAARIDTKYAYQRDSGQFRSEDSGKQCAKGLELEHFLKSRNPYLLPVTLPAPVNLSQFRRIVQHRIFCT